MLDEGFARLVGYHQSGFPITEAMRGPEPSVAGPCAANLVPKRQVHIRRSIHCRDRFLKPPEHTEGIPGCHHAECMQIRSVDQLTGRDQCLRKAERDVRINVQVTFRFVFQDRQKFINGEIVDTLRDPEASRRFVAQRQEVADGGVERKGSVIVR